MSDNTEKPATVAPTAPEPPPAMPPTDPSRRRTSIGLNVVARVVLVLCLLAMVNYLAARHYSRLDVTRSSMYTLSAKTKRVIRGLRSDVTVDVFLSQGSPIFAGVKELFSRYRAESTRIKVHFTDPDQDRARFEMMRARYGIQEAHLPDGRTISDAAIVVASGDRHWFITQDEIVDVDFSEGGFGGGGPELKSFKAEGALTSALLNVTQREKPKICFTKGHGELSIEDFGERGLQHYAEALKRDNYETKAIETYGRASLPADCNAIIVAGPTRPFAEEEAALLGSFVQGGGRLAMFLDPIIDRDRLIPTGLESVAERFGVRLDNDVVVETDTERLTSLGGPETFALLDWALHPLASPFKGMPLVVGIARSVRKSEGGTALATELVKTSGHAWGITSLARMQAGEEPTRGEGDPEGPLSLAAAVETGVGRRQGRLVVVGDSDLLQRLVFENYTLVNNDFALGVVAWLSQRESLISIAPKDVDNVRMTVTEDELWRIGIYSVVCMPLAAILLGVVVWLKRRQ